jgi:naphthoate synthase
MNHNPFHASAWRPVDGFADLTDITYHRHIYDATVRLAFNRPEVHNAFRPHTVDELDEAVEGRDAFLEKRDSDYGRFPRYF